MNKLTITAVAALLGLSFAGGALAEGKGSHKMKGHKAGLHMLKKMDANKDGAVSKEEFDAFSATRFSSGDVNGNGMSLAEFTALHEKTQMEREKEREARKKAMTAKMFSKIDSNGDGKISAEEHAAGSAKMFGRMDSNEDGVLSKADRRHKKSHKKGRME